MKPHFITPFFAAFAKILIVSKIWEWGGGGGGKLNFNSQLLPIKYSDFVFNLLKVCIDNVSYGSVSSVGLFFSNLFRFIEMGCFK